MYIIMQFCPSCTFNLQNLNLSYFSILFPDKTAVSVVGIVVSQKRQNNERKEKIQWVKYQPKGGHNCVVGQVLEQRMT